MSLDRRQQKIKEWQERSRDRQIAKRNQNLKSVHTRQREKMTGPPKPRKPLKKASQRQKRRLCAYYVARAEYLSTHPACLICLLLDEHPAPATEVHHVFGRGPNTADPRGFCACCRFHREWPHANPAEARRLGVLGPASLWCVPIDKHPQK